MSDKGKIAQLEAANESVLQTLAEKEAEINRQKRWIEDLHSGMYINCVYCGHRYGPKKDTPVAMADILKAHIEQCPEHPMSKLKAENERLVKENAALKATLDDSSAPASGGQAERERPLGPKLVERLTKLAEKDLPSDAPDFNPCDWSGGNFDDAYSLGVDVGETYVAREVLAAVRAVQEKI